MMSGERPALNNETRASCTIWDPDHLIQYKRLILLVDGRSLFTVSYDKKALILGATESSPGEYLLIRPGFARFFQQLQQYYLFYMYSSNDKVQRMPQVVNRIDPEGKIFINKWFGSEHISGTIDPNNTDTMFKYFHKETRKFIVAISDTATFSEFSNRFLTITKYAGLHSIRNAFSSDCGISCLHPQFRIKKVDNSLEVTLGRLINIYNAFFNATPRVPDNIYMELMKYKNAAWRENARSKNPATRPPVSAPGRDATARKIERLTREYLIQNRKLILLVDLDNTIINSTLDPMASLVFREGIIPCNNFYLKTRPFLKEFLRFAETRFEMVVTTFGSAGYAADIVNNIDPTQEYFHNRLLTIGDIDMDARSKENVLDLFPTNVQDMIVIIDDRVDVWPTTPTIPVDEYKFFFEFKTAFNAERISRLSRDPAAPDRIRPIERDNCLNVVRQKLEQLHTACYGSDPARPAAVRDMLLDMWEGEHAYHEACRNINLHRRWHERRARPG